MYKEMGFFGKVKPIVQNTSKDLAHFKRSYRLAKDLGEIEPDIDILTEAFNTVRGVSTEMCCNGHFNEDAWVDFICTREGLHNLELIWKYLMVELDVDIKVFMSLSRVMLGSMHKPDDELYEKVRFSISAHRYNNGFSAWTQVDGTSGESEDDWEFNEKLAVQLRREWFSAIADVVYSNWGK